jgi:hypothetical protein
MTSQQRAYLSGLLDGDGSIIIQLKPRDDMKYRFRVKSVVIIYQDSKYHSRLVELRGLIGAGYVYRRNDRISELRVEGHMQVASLIVKLLPYLRFKHVQATLMLEALSLIRRKYSVDEFLSVCRIADEISANSYASKRRKYTAYYVEQVLHSHNLIPVTTGSPPLAG